MVTLAFWEAAARTPEYFKIPKTATVKVIRATLAVESEIPIIFLKKKEWLTMNQDTVGQMLSSSNVLVGTPKGRKAYRAGIKGTCTVVPCYRRIG